MLKLSGDIQTQLTNLSYQLKRYIVSQLTAKSFSYQLKVSAIG